MTAPPLARDTRFRLGWLMLLAVALLARSVAPEGWMPVAGANGIEIAVCNGMGPMVLSSDGTLNRKAPARGEVGDHGCAFAGMAVANTPPPPPAIMALVRAAPVAALPGRIAIAPGRGLAAPPPPATGPPALA